MKQYLASLIRTAPSPTQARNLVREYLQARILGSLQRAGATIPLAFHEGTALRFLYAIPRYSEDLDLALERARSEYDLRAYLRAIQSECSAEGYLVGTPSVAAISGDLRPRAIWSVCVGAPVVPFPASERSRHTPIL